MADVDQIFTDRWRSGRHLAQNKPGQYARVRRGFFHRDYQPFTFLDGSSEDFATIVGGHDATPWWAKWTPQSDWMELPNVTQVSKTQGFDNNGFQTVTIEVENVVYKAITGVAGLYHAIRRGYLAPWMGFATFGRPTFALWMHEQNEWYDLIDGAQIEVWQGYGPDHFSRVFTGLIGDVDMTSNPDHMTLTATCFGDNALGQQFLFGSVKDPKLKGPITFADRLSSDDIKKVGGAARASSEASGYPARYVTKPGNHTWMSAGHGAADVTEWVEIHLPRGRYETFGIFPFWSGMEMFVGMYIRDRVKADAHHAQKKAQVDNVDVDEGWYNPNATLVPGANGGWPYFKHYGSIDNHEAQHRLDHQFEVGDDTILRIGFRNLHYHPDTKDYRAAVKRLLAYQRHQKKDVKKNNWVLVDDAADVVKVALRWAGFREWEVEDMGVRLKQPLVFHQSDALIDIVNRMVGMADYVFFMGDPTSDDLSIGVPKFRHTRATQAPGGPLLEVRDTDLLTGISVKLSKALKAARIYVRGARPKKGSGERGLGQLGEDPSSRGVVGATYVPPWRPKLSNILKHTVHTDRLCTTTLDCKVMCILIALQQSLQSSTGQIEIPGNPEPELDEQISILDEGTGTNTRIWVASRQDTFTSGIGGNPTTWKTTLGGSWIDTHDNLSLFIDFLGVMNAKQAEEDAPHATGGRPQGRDSVTASGPGVGVKF